MKWWREEEMKREREKEQGQCDYLFFLFLSFFLLIYMRIIYSWFSPLIQIFVVRVPKQQRRMQEKEKEKVVEDEDEKEENICKEEGELMNDWLNLQVHKYWSVGMLGVRGDGPTVTSHYTILHDVT